MTQNKYSFSQFNKEDYRGQGKPLSLCCKTFGFLLIAIMLTSGIQLYKLIKNPFLDKICMLMDERSFSNLLGQNIMGFEIVQ